MRTILGIMSQLSYEELEQFVKEVSSDVIPACVMQAKLASADNF